ncbi:MAG TPA: hypothetical protein DDZ80_08885 [Cyanobacteria bacterium UBA8803]|nr:hypothetical protein [Cyanobacteria bacterium UBA8803]
MPPKAKIGKFPHKALPITVGNGNSTPSQNGSQDGERSADKLRLDWRLGVRAGGFGVDSSFPLAGLLVQHPSHWHGATARTVSSVTPLFTKAIAAISTRLVVDLSDAKAYSYWGNKLIATYPIAVGQPGWETPTGTFKVLQKQRNPVWKQPITGDLIPTGPNNPLGDRWIGFWADERHQIGFHGTQKEELIGKAISHGCLRMRNSDIRALYEQVNVGTPVIVRR